MLGPDVLVLATEFFPKYPGDEGTDWHQADTFANASGDPQIVVWRWTRIRRRHHGLDGLHRGDKETGCLRFIPGTHEEMFYDETKRMDYNPDTINLQQGWTAPGFFGYDYRELQKDPNWQPDESRPCR